MKGSIKGVPSVRTRGKLPQEWPLRRALRESSWTGEVVGSLAKRNRHVVHIHHGILLSH